MTQGYSESSGSGWVGYVYPNSNRTTPAIQCGTPIVDGFVANPTVKGYRLEGVAFCSPRQ